MSRKNRHYFTLSLAITSIFILLGVFVFDKSYIRLNEGFIDLFSSIKYYVCEIFGIEHHILPTVELYSNVLEWDILLPKDFENFKVKTVQYFKLLFSSENFVLWGKQVGTTLSNFGKIIAIILPCLLLLYFGIKRLYTKTNTDYNKDTIPLLIFKKVSKVTYVPIKTIILEFIEFLKTHNYFYILWIIIWVLHLNLATILIEFIAYYLYFAVSFKLGTVYVQFRKLFIDLQVVFKTIPIWIIIPLVWLIFDRFRKNLAMNKLRHYEAKNCGFIKALPIVSITCGSMGKKKTTMVTDMALSQEVMFRQQALKILQKADMKFPHFPWICFEHEIQKCMEFGVIYNLATVKEWVSLKRSRFEKHHNANWQLYGYNIEIYGKNYNDSLKISNLFDVLETYAQAYFIYVIESSLIVSNYSIRTDNELTTLGNFPMWNIDFFPKDIVEGRHSHVLDFDVLRLGKKIIENNPKSGSFEFGVVVITEVGKERGNNLELKEIKKGNYETNQKNDLFNSWLKMCRHSATVDNYPFIKVFTDEQRPESWGADARDLCDIVTIIESSEQKLALPFYTIEEMLSDWLTNWFINLYYDFRFRRGDNTLLVYVLKSITYHICHRNLCMYNKYGYSTLKIEKERGTGKGYKKSSRYYLMNKKIYSRRFSTDCFSDYFNETARKTDIGLNDYIEYAAEKASVKELKSQNSYFINSIYKED